MAGVESLKRVISEERKRREIFDVKDLLGMIEDGRIQEAVDTLIYFAAPTEVAGQAEALKQAIADRFAQRHAREQTRHLCFLADLALALRSFLPRWNLQDGDRHGDAALSDAQVVSLAGEIQTLADELAGVAPVAAKGLLDDWQKRTVARLKTEGAADPAGEAAALVGDSIGETIDNLAAALARSNLRRIACMRANGQTTTELGNDYAAFLPYALLLGISFATTNPPLVDRAWLADRDRWDSVVDSVIAAHAEADADELARWVTLEIVLENMRRLRPIFLLAAGEMGCVCLQVNPHLHGDAAGMIRDARFFYRELQRRLDGGVPNVVFKLPGTRAGLKACRCLTGEGIGVTITVNFGLFQHLPFAEAIAGGTAIYACLVEMNGRLAYPVRDELLSKLDQLAADGIDEVAAREAAAWAGVAVVKRVYRLLLQRGYDMGRMRPLIASLRVYEGEPYQCLPSPFPDVTETLGARIISVFPDVRRACDAYASLPLRPMQVEEALPPHVWDVLAHSEIFRQACYVGDRDGVEKEAFRPERVLALEHEDDVLAWQPVHDTLTGFIEAYDGFVMRILERAGTA